MDLKIFLTVLLLSNDFETLSLFLNIQNLMGAKLNRWLMPFSTLVSVGDTHTSINLEIQFPVL